PTRARVSRRANNGRVENCRVSGPFFVQPERELLAGRPNDLKAWHHVGHLGSARGIDPKARPAAGPTDHFASHDLKALRVPRIKSFIAVIIAIDRGYRTAKPRGQRIHLLAQWGQAKSRAFSQSRVEFEVSAGTVHFDNVDGPRPLGNVVAMVRKPAGRTR